ncbi:MAG: hypothetical protein HZA11_03365 [Nitrospirae bacterium]|nr:hypothetical protein [Nitrospirota bacterium]
MSLSPAVKKLLPVAVALFVFILIGILPSSILALDNPHNINNSVNCENCHTTTLPGSTLHECK